MGQSKSKNDSLAIDRYVVEAAVNVIFHFQGYLRSVGGDLLEEIEVDEIIGGLDALLEALEEVLNA